MGIDTEWHACTMEAVFLGFSPDAFTPTIEVESSCLSIYNLTFCKKSMIREKREHSISGCYSLLKNAEYWVLNILRYSHPIPYRPEKISLNS